MSSYSVKNLNNYDHNVYEITENDTDSTCEVFLDDLSDIGCDPDEIDFIRKGYSVILNNPAIDTIHCIFENYNDD